MTFRVILCALLIGVAGIASAQDKPAQQQQPATNQQQPAATQRQQLTREQRAALQKRNKALVQYANQIVAMIDNGQIGDVWDQASSVAKQAVSRDAFIKATQDARSGMGKVKSRFVRVVTSAVSKGGKLPQGDYVTVNYTTQFTDNPKPILEKVSFHLDSDKKWRLSGYVLP